MTRNKFFLNLLHLPLTAVFDAAFFNRSVYDKHPSHPKDLENVPFNRQLEFCAQIDIKSSDSAFL